MEVTKLVKLFKSNCLDWFILEQKSTLWDIRFYWRASSTNWTYNITSDKYLL